MTSNPHLSNAPEPDWGDRMEQSVLDSALGLAPRLGWNARLVREACAANDLSEGDQALLLPNGPRDLAALLWRRHDAEALAELGDPAGRLVQRMHPDDRRADPSGTGVQVVEALLVVGHRGNPRRG